MPSPLFRVRFLSRLNAAEAALAARDWDALDGFITELSPMAESIGDDTLFARWEALFAAADPELRG